ncbi:hypothetical protein [Bradyrhizobium sp. CCBAU 21362]|uniref:hypothetical protein n=1 Tax=Bradyrhizobium sp. CCBAU 21362 TaxID=1325082 RepID=UPI00230600CC|nr:hypothetical protein [Bradyrhizobium sp. CCBAU 21362]
MTDDLRNQYDPDRWMALGRNLRDFRSGGPEAEAFYATDPELGRDVERWRWMMAEASYRASMERDIERVVEDDLRDMWDAVRRRNVS